MSQSNEPAPDAKWVKGVSAKQRKRPAERALGGVVG